MAKATRPPQKELRRFSQARMASLAMSRSCLQSVCQQGGFVSTIALAQTATELTHGMHQLCPLCLTNLTNCLPKPKPSTMSRSIVLSQCLDHPISHVICIPPTPSPGCVLLCSECIPSNSFDLRDCTEGEGQSEGISENGEAVANHAQKEERKRRIDHLVQRCNTIVKEAYPQTLSGCAFGKPSVKQASAVGVWHLCCCRLMYGTGSRVPAGRGKRSVQPRGRRQKSGVNSALWKASRCAPLRWTVHGNSLVLKVGLQVAEFLAPFSHMERPRLTAARQRGRGTNNGAQFTVACIDHISDSATISAGSHLKFPTCLVTSILSHPSHKNASAATPAEWLASMKKRMRAAERIGPLICSVRLSIVRASRKTWMTAAERMGPPTHRTLSPSQRMTGAETGATPPFCCRQPPPSGPCESPRRGREHTRGHALPLRAGAFLFRKAAGHVQQLAHRALPTAGHIVWIWIWWVDSAVGSLKSLCTLAQQACVALHCWKQADRTLWYASTPAFRLATY
eukprot:scaffold5102_cov17-Tisochrysis_lutea.AAC.2